MGNAILKCIPIKSKRRRAPDPPQDDAVVQTLEEAEDEEEFRDFFMRVNRATSWLDRQRQLTYYRVNNIIMSYATPRYKYLSEYIKELKNNSCPIPEETEEEINEMDLYVNRLKNAMEESSLAIQDNVLASAY